MRNHFWSICLLLMMSWHWFCSNSCAVVLTVLFMTKKKNKQTNKQTKTKKHTVNVLKILTQCFMFLQNDYKCSCRNSFWPFIYEQTPQQLHPLGTRRDSGGHWNSLLGSLIYEPPHDKTIKMTVRPAKTQISLGIRPVWSVFIVRPMGSY